MYFATVPKNTLKIKAPPVPVFVDEYGHKTNTPTIIESISVVPEVTDVTISIVGEEQKEIVSNRVETEHETYRPLPKSRYTSIINLDDSNAWSLLTDGKFAEYPTQPFYQVKDALYKIHADKKKTITVPIWYWEDPSDDTNFNKVTKSYEWEVNEEIAPLCKEIFTDIYNDPSKPIINIGDKGMGTWNVRGKMHSDYKTLSAHSIGASFDINPSTGTYRVNGTLYGNGYNNQPMPIEIWEQLPEEHKKYNVLYIDSPIVRIFKQHGFYWGGDWNSSKDCMHLAFLGDGVNAREIGKSNYALYNNF